MTTKKFIRRDSNRYAKLGKGRRKKQVWRKPKGRDTQTRLKRKGYPAIVSIGFRTEASGRKKIEGLFPILISNEKDLNSLDVKKNSAIISRRLGAKKKIGVIKKAEEMKIKILNVKLGGKK